MIGGILRDGTMPLIDLVYPPRCPSCGDAIGEQNGLCQGCWSGLAIPSGPGCSSCSRPFGESDPGAGSICGPCMAYPPAHDGIAAGTLYTETSRKLVLAYKHGRRIGLAPLMAKLIAARLPVPEAEQLIVPVPLHRWRLWKRGYNQAAMLGRELERLGHGRLVVDGLVRHKQTPSLGGMGAKKRAKLLAGSISMSEKGRSIISGRHIVLVDDVLTSGATTTVCVKELKRSGARSVVIACFARVLDEALDSVGRQSDLGR